MFEHVCVATTSFCTATTKACVHLTGACESMSVLNALELAERDFVLIGGLFSCVVSPPAT